jgi:hypothetical protein
MQDSSVLKIGTVLEFMIAKGTDVVRVLVPVSRMGLISHCSCFVILYIDGLTFRSLKAS